MDVDASQVERIGGFKRRTALKNFWFVVFMLILAGCSTVKTDVNSYGKIYPPTDPKLVRILYEYPPQEFFRIGEVELTDSAFGQEHSVAQKKKLREAAAGIGGDAVVIRQDAPLGRSNEQRFSVASAYDPQTGFNANASAVGPHDYGRRLIAVVIKFQQ